MARTVKYPAAAVQAKLAGYTQVKFTVSNGEAADISVAGPALGMGLEQEVMRSVLSFKEFGTVPDGKYLLKTAFSIVDDQDKAVPSKNVKLPAVPGHQLLNTIHIRSYLPKTSNTPADYSKYTADESGKVYDFISLDRAPTFPGGMQKFYEYVGKTIRYPKEAQDKNTQGKVFLSFVVETDGSLTDIKVERKLGSGTDEEAVRVIKESPRWIPGVQNEKLVRVKYNIPIAFSLSTDEKKPPLANVESLLGGKVTGIRVNSGKSADSDSTVQIRVGDPNATIPLYIVDGVKIDNKPGPDGKLLSPLATIRQEDIEKIEVLKDESATTIYGSAGKNGVIIVTTKSGAKKAATNKKKD